MAQQMSREQVRAAQRMLNRLGVRDDRGRPLKVDGILGPRTLAALQNYAQQQQADAAMPTPRPKPQRMFSDPTLAADIAAAAPPPPMIAPAGQTAPTPGFDPLAGVRRQMQPPPPASMFAGPTPGAQPMAPPPGGGMGGTAMAIGSGPQSYQFSRPPMIPDSLQGGAPPMALMMAAARAAASRQPQTAMPQRGYQPPPDSFAPAEQAPIGPQGPMDAAAVNQMAMNRPAFAPQAPQPRAGPLPVLPDAPLAVLVQNAIRSLQESAPGSAPATMPTDVRSRYPGRKPRALSSNEFSNRAQRSIDDVQTQLHPPVGWIDPRNGLRFKGGDPRLIENWERAR